jgi:hypothetical protein
MFKRILSLALVAGAGLVMAACGTRTQTFPTTLSRSFDPVCDEGVAVFNDFSEVPYDYYEVAFITSEQNAVYTDKGQMVTAMRKRAGEQGGNGLVVASSGNTKTGIKILGGALGTNSAEREGKAVAIYMPGDELRVKNACGKS